MTSKRKKEAVSFPEMMLKFKRAGFSHKGAGTTSYQKIDLLASLNERISCILEIQTRNHLEATKMLYFILYDIENNKVRTQIAKYLIKNGCLRVQKSVFFAESERAVFDQIHKDLRTIQELYDNNDSIFFIPVSADQLRSMKIVGQSIDFELITGSKTTLFF